MPGRETQDWMWEAIEKKAVQGEKKHILKPWLKMAASIAAAVLVFVVLLPQTSFAEHIQGFLKQFFYVGADVEQDIAKNVYEDTGKYGHVKMQIQEMLSDGAYVYGNICYEALDTWGEKWLAEQEFDWESIRVSWVLDDNEEWFEGGGSTVFEQEELATEKKRYFAFQINEFSGNFNLKDRSITLFYPMYKSQGIGKVDIVTNLDTVSYRLVGDKSPSKYYEPKYLVVSKLSYAILGEDYGIRNDWVDEDGKEHFYSKGFLEEKGDKEYEDFVYFYGLPLSFTMKDGSKLDMGWADPSLYETKGLSDAHLLISEGHFNNDRDAWERNMTIKDPGALAGVDIDGVHYDLVKEEIPEK